MNKIYFYLIFLWIITGCKEKYDSPVITPETGYLVVEGAINSGQGITDITLSRTTKLDSRKTVFELGASVRVEADDNTFNVLTEKTAGHYIANNLNLNTQKKYRLNIKTKAGKEYLSDFLTIKNNPPIDSIYWQRETNGVQLYVNTHDSEGNTRYYLWEFTETWEHPADFKSYLKYEVITGGQRGNTYKVVYRDPNNNNYFDSSMYFCWQSQVSTQILIGTSVKLSKDEINLPLTFIPSTSAKLNALYSIQVKQKSLTKEAFEFLEIMKKNSEMTGTIFDAQPAVLYGNIHGVTDPNEPVIGYLSICPIQEKRIFIDHKQVPNWDYNSNCKETMFSNNSNTIRDKSLGFMPTNVVPLLAPFPTIVSFFAAPPECVDCRLSGTNVKPSFWPN
ncbi:hypothetical protein EMA8858_00030 [Emticicia aquatica]|jgi:Domain of unknown function (DUF4249)|uniref:DUF4249 domain-containing protein n=1 Tax=Emticicia aquatica TaxID=1681835 RepID=A0ABM9AJQ0_9BACT|nr:DUF4249 domain-containing protein [Emticicia aquatica]CAH0993925.1 hypothetical protein EMA8858_00030 [Emticicia aquatica]